LKSKNISSFGLDIGSYAVKCVEITHGGQAVELHRVVILPLPDNSPDSLKKNLRVFLDGLPVPPKKVRIAVSGPNVLTRRISLPSMTAAELKGAIRFEAERHIPFSIDECVLDSQILNSSPDKKTMNVMLVAAKKDLVLQRVKLLEELGLYPDMIDVDIFCLMNAFEGLSAGDMETKTVGILNIGHRTSSFAILQDKQPFFVREIPLGGLGVTRAIVEAAGMTEADADALKIQKPAESAEVLKAATQKGLEPLAEELHHSIDYFENETGEELKTIWMSGGGALSLGTAEFFTEELGKNVSLWDNTKKMSILGSLDTQYLSQNSPLLNVVLGMALRGTGRGK
jgi:type IV pilus assembly protein PilM